MWDHSDSDSTYVLAENTLAKSLSILAAYSGSLVVFYLVFKFKQQDLSMVFAANPFATELPDIEVEAPSWASFTEDLLAALGV
eukprot:CAMPEP_0170509038 /NCGR_PEP_ID=MMETSP0208-20121228/64193_1 /TAXON_ID=197538 /ORGANISM="Strombidium inclinatum, Strain S3" /LENGTH=82 /DNA_ID=CAMNT_0010792245 /DNA_START=271 /DNA_END=515 /DNA_ORIENTATION=-